MQSILRPWVSRYGSPETLTTDQGSQFESELFSALLQLIGCNRIRNTAYHPASNGMIERWQRSLKTAIMGKIKPIPVAQKYKRNAFVFKELSSCSHVFLRDHARKALERPYTGPHKVLNRPSDRVSEIEVNGVSRHVFVENIKPAHSCVKTSIILIHRKM